MELIDRDAAIALIEQRQKELCPVGRFGRNAVYDTDRDIFDAWDEIIDQITALPTIDAAPVVHGRWVKFFEMDLIICSVCKHEAYWDTDYGQQKFPYCPYCGARMGGNTMIDQDKPHK